MAALALGTALCLAGCGEKAPPPDDEGSLPAATEAAPPAAEPPPAPGGDGEPAAPAAAPLTPEQDSAREEAAFTRRKASMESLESCLAKAAEVDEPARTTLRTACTRSRVPR